MPQENTSEEWHKITGEKKGRDESRPYITVCVVRFEAYTPLRFFSSSINCGTTLKRSPTTPKSEY